MNGWEVKAKYIEAYIYARKGASITVLEPTTPEQWDMLERAFVVAFTRLTQSGA